MIEVSENRKFQGIWIPAEIWLATDLTVMEKLFLVEIDSLDNSDGCFKSNSGFAKFFGISAGRCSQIITSLEGKNLIKVHYQRKGKQIKKRTIRVVNKLKGGSKYSKGGYLENAEERGNSLGITVLDKNTCAFEDEFKAFWDAGLPKQKKPAAKEKFQKLLAAHPSPTDFANHLVTDIGERLRLGQLGIDKMHPTTYLNGKRWEDEYPKESSNGNRHSNNQPRLSAVERVRQATARYEAKAERDGRVVEAHD